MPSPRSAFLDEVDGDREAAAHRLGTALQLARAAPRAGRRAARALRPRVHVLLRRRRQRVAAGAAGRDDPRDRERAALERPGVELRLLHAIALYVSGDLDGSLAAAQTPPRAAPRTSRPRGSAAVSCYAAVARGPRMPQPGWPAARQLGHRPAGRPGRGRLRGRPPHLGGRPRGRRSTIADRAQTHLDTAAGEGMYGGLWLSALALGALADDATTAARAATRPGRRPRSAQGDVLLQRVERIVPAATGGRETWDPRGARGRPAPWPSTPACGRAGRRGVAAALEAFGYGHAYEQARCRWRLADALVAAGDRAAARTQAGRRGRRGGADAAPCRSGVPSPRP